MRHELTEPWAGESAEAPSVLDPQPEATPAAPERARRVAPVFAPAAGEDGRRLSMRNA